jgi:alkanesulfonate monooxygenase SsuD/methylene tetrahydromethanopterin reductase-like flavin-dependent oxidoreductase (luciferase family)
VSLALAIKLPMYAQDPDAPFDALLTVAQEAEDAGFVAAYVIDHLLLPTARVYGKTSADLTRPYHIDAWPTMAAIAARTSRIIIGPQVTPIGLRHPVFVAKWGAAIDRISKGRFRLGVGVGHQELEYRALGFPFPPFPERLARLVEGVELIRLLWEQEEPVTFKGTHYQVEDVPFWPKPVQDRVEIWFGGTSPAIQRTTAAIGDGWFPAAPQTGGLDAGLYRDGLASIRAKAEEHGRAGAVDAGALFMTTISDDRDDLEAAADLLRQRKDANGYLDYAGLSVEEISEQGAILIGTPDDIVRRLEPFVEAGLREITLSFLPLDDMESFRRGIELYATKVLPRLG